ncbi:MAG: hypothetical protein AAF483_08390 [Planctomycetota bacterium]
MICDALHEDEILEAYLIYASLHGQTESVEQLKQRVHDYCHCNVPNAAIDESILAYLEDEILAPPDVVLDRWGASRVYQLKESSLGDHRHSVCESWFENGCQLPANAPDFVHFWTEAGLVPSMQHELLKGIRLQLGKTPDGDYVNLVHRQIGVVGRLVGQLSDQLASDLWCHRKFLAIVDRKQPPQDSWDEFVEARLRLLVVSAGASVCTRDVVAYTKMAFWAKRSKC